MGMAGKNYVWSNTERWRRIGPDKLTINGRNIDTVKIEYDTRAGAGSNYNAVWELWYDPLSHLLLKG
jgi:hypothetical protein